MSQLAPSGVVDHRRLTVAADGPDRVTGLEIIRHTQIVTLSDDPVNALRDLPFTYPERGWTAWSQPPYGYHAAQRSAVLGAGPELFARAGVALMEWRMHRRAGIELIATDHKAVVGARVLLRVGLGPLAVTAPCQVVYTVHDDHHRGFAYGTLTGHPVSGEESFVVTLGPDDRVTFTVRAFSRPATLLARLGGPFTPLVQQFGLSRYLQAMTALARAET
jgi:uncharacterized protein (UPF0548 family)